MGKRVILIVLDSVGAGELPDAKDFNDEGSNTIGNIAKALDYFRLENLEKLGLGNIADFTRINKNKDARGSFGKCAEVSKGKDTVTGHLEISGLVLKKPLNTYPNGFPKDIIDEFEQKIGRKVLGNKVASGTEIIKELGEEHMKTGSPIVYTSADSVFQVAAHEDIIPLDELYRICSIAREMLMGDRLVGRVIARPFIGKPGSFVRTTNRRDYALDPFGETILDYVSKAGLKTMAVGKIHDIFNGRGITDTVHIVSNMDGVDKTIDFMKKNEDGLIFTNLVDFDMLYGHRNDVEGYGKALMEFDKRVPEIISNMTNDDVLMITADHGCDPTTPSTDHSREYIPLLVYGKNINLNVNLGIRKSFTDIGKTVLDILSVKNNLLGESFYSLIKK